MIIDDVCWIDGKFLAKDIHSGERGQIEQAIRKQMVEILDPKGFIIDNVLLKSIKLPDGLAKTIEEKLQAEQEAQRMEFVKERERRDAERRIIEAEGKSNAMRIEADAIKRANDTINKTLTPATLKLLQIEAFCAISNSNNSKLLITDGKTPFLSIPDKF